MICDLCRIIIFLYIVDPQISIGQAEEEEMWWRRQEDNEMSSWPTQAYIGDIYIHMIFYQIYQRYVSSSWPTHAYIGHIYIYMIYILSNLAKTCIFIIFRQLVSKVFCMSVFKKIIISSWPTHEWWGYISVFCSPHIYTFKVNYTFTYMLVVFKFSIYGYICRVIVHQIFIGWA